MSHLMPNAKPLNTRKWNARYDKHKDSSFPILLGITSHVILLLPVTNDSLPDVLNSRKFELRSILEKFLLPKWKLKTSKAGVDTT